MDFYIVEREREREDMFFGNDEILLLYSRLDLLDLLFKRMLKNLR